MRARRARFSPQARWAGALLLAALAAGLLALIEWPAANDVARDVDLLLTWSEGPQLIERRGEP